MKQFIIDEVELTVSNSKVQVCRKGWRTTLKDSVNKQEFLERYLAGQIPYFYREPNKIAGDFRSRRNALDLVNDLATKAPTVKSFQQSHCGEILCALYLEKVIGLRRLYSKLTLTSAENTNIHKMDGFFVNTTTNPFSYYAVEAKSSILPTSLTRFSGHKGQILKQMIESFNKYDEDDQRFDFVTIRDNLEEYAFSEKESEQIRDDLLPPGPQTFFHLGMAAINKSTIKAEDDDFILSIPCTKSFNYRAVVISDLAKLATDSFGLVHKLKGI